MELYEYSAHELSKMLSEKKCSSEELTKSVLDRAAATEEKVGAYLTVCGEEALKKAREVDEKRAKEALHPLEGIPIGIKDNISTKGLLTTCASKMLFNYVPPFDAFVMKKVNAADMVVTGKLNMDEFAMGSSTENSYFKKTHNPHNLDCVPGGSSGGSAAAVAAGSAVISLGSDTGGSIRMPASYCGVVGLKPTYGSVSRYGLVAFASSLDQIGPFGRNVTDTAMLYSVICGHDNMDATSVDRDYPDFTALLSSDVKGLKIGIPEEYYGEGVDNSVKETVMNAVKDLEKQGAEIVNISLPSTKYALNAYYIISSAEASSNLARFDGVKYGYRTENYDSLIDMYEKTRSEGFGDEVKRRIMLGTFVLSSGFFDAYYKKAKLVALDIVGEFNAAFEKCDVIATPATPATAFRLGENIGDPTKMYAADICTVTVNIAGLPAISVPCGKVNDMPAGLQFIGKKFSEQTLLNAALAVEKNYGEAKPVNV